MIDDGQRALGSGEVGEMDLRDRVVVISGATGGLGSVVARTLGEEGARLALFSSNLERVGGLAKDLALAEGRVLTGALDFTEAEAGESAAKMVLEKFGRIDVLLHLVGGWMAERRLWTCLLRRWLIC